VLPEIKLMDKLCNFS